MECRLCGHKEFETLVDLGTSPLANALLTKEDLAKGEMWFPLHAQTCTKCKLTQLDEFERPGKIFNKDYPYFSSQSPAFVEHAANLVRKVENEFKPSGVVEIASNDGYLLQHFTNNVKVMGVEPSQACADEAKAKRIPTWTGFWSEGLADLAFRDKIDVILGLNVLAHVPDLHDFIAGVRIALKKKGVAIFEFPYLGRLIEDLQFDTIYHEHFSYFSLGAVNRAFARHNMHVFDTELLPVHGGSLRIYVTHMTNTDYNHRCRSGSLTDKLLWEESQEDSWVGWQRQKRFAGRVLAYRNSLQELMASIEPHNWTVSAYGAAAKGNTLINYCGFDKDTLDFVVDSTPAKQGKYLPGSRIPIVAPLELERDGAEYVWILPWNWHKQIADKLPAHVENIIVRNQVYRRTWDGRYIPT